MEWIGTAALWVVGSIVGIVILVFAVKWFAQPDENGAGGGGGMFGGLDEAFNPGQHNANLEMERRRHLPVESAVPGDRAWESDAMRIGYGADGTPETIVLKSARAGRAAQASSTNGSEPELNETAERIEAADAPDSDESAANAPDATEDDTPA
ncbi:hypothetical protein GCM10010401_04810 [Rarobacter faecitabidus]|uniref:Uncharacterized protein n=1 Tax=Rarobacter faecitabidus TaxID=13243 RepID=A0A542ZTS7_RARFA|nr:hypothetical protein [Rarobacter faecitabidus]TQL63763.1 hypothetical protein FB461_0236 [Rarobacter faecitabidus]